MIASQGYSKCFILSGLKVSDYSNRPVVGSSKLCIRWNLLRAERKDWPRQRNRLVVRDNMLLFDPIGRNLVGICPVLACAGQDVPTIVASAVDGCDLITPTCKTF